MDQQLRDDTLAAIAVVTAANGEAGENKTLASRIANEWTNETPDGAVRLATGFVQLCIVLLATIKHDTGKSPEVALQEAADLMNNWSDD